MEQSDEEGRKIVLLRKAWCHYFALEQILTEFQAWNLLLEITDSPYLALIHLTHTLSLSTLHPHETAGVHTVGERWQRSKASITCLPRGVGPRTVLLLSLLPTTLLFPDLYWTLTGKLSASHPLYLPTCARAHIHTPLLSQKASSTQREKRKCSTSMKPYQCTPSQNLTWFGGSFNVLVS